MIFWLVSTYDYCAPKWEAGIDCTGAPMGVGTWVVAILAWAIGFALLLKLLHYGITGTLRLFLGRPNPRSREYKIQFSHVRKLVLKRDNYRCVVCGGVDALDVHHRILRSQGGTNEMTNLVTLCRFHHGQVHGRNWK